MCVCALARIQALFVPALDTAQQHSHSKTFSAPPHCRKHAAASSHSAATTSNTTDQSKPISIRLPVIRTPQMPVIVAQVLK